MNIEKEIVEKHEGVTIYLKPSTEEIGFKGPRHLCEAAMVDVREHLTEVLDYLRSVNPDVAEMAMTYKRAPSLDVQFGNYRLWLGGRGGSIGLQAHYYSPSQAEFEKQCEATRKVADANGGQVRLHFNFAFSWDCEVLTGSNIGTIYRIDRSGRINGIEEPLQSGAAA